MAYVAKGLRFDPRDAVIISGDPRGGTTWLAEILSKNMLLATLWEPLALAKVKRLQDIGFENRQFLPPEHNWREADAYFDDLFAGRVLNAEICKRTNTAELRSAEGLLVKFCRANLLLPYLVDRYEFSKAPIHLVRHPCAVVASQLKQGGWMGVKDYFTLPSGRYSEFVVQHREFLSRVDSKEKHLAAWWCLGNQHLLERHAGETKWLTVYYEDLLIDPNKELSKIAARWRLGGVLENTRKPSSTTLSSSPVYSGDIDRQLGFWREALSERQVADILTVLDYFGVQAYRLDTTPYSNCAEAQGG